MEEIEENDIARDDLWLDVIHVKLKLQLIPFYLFQQFRLIWSRHYRRH